jgi:hypothetical protein
MRLKEEILIDAKQLVDRCKEFQVIGSNVMGAATSVRELEYFEITLGSLIKDLKRFSKYWAIVGPAILKSESD